MSDADAFRLAGVRVRFGTTRAIDGVDLAIDPGERVAVIGPSGSGKTTLFRLLNSEIIPSEGDIHSLGTLLSQATAPELRRLRSKIALIPQDLALVPNIRVIQNVVMGRFGSKGFFASLRDFMFTTSGDTAAIHRLLSRIGIGEKLYERTETLSGGQLQRVAIARALFAQPEAILADEPVSSVDPARAEDAVQLLTRISEEESITLVMALHNTGLARSYFPRIIGLKQGRVQFDCSPADFTDEMVEELYQLDSTELLENG